MLIYKITNDINDKVYIGQTTKTLEERIAQHRNAFVTGVTTHIYNAMRKYGWDKFHFHILDDSPLTQEELDMLEKKYIIEYDSINYGYNMIEGGSGINPMFYEKARTKHDAIMRSDEVRAKISHSMKESYAKRGGPSMAHRNHLSEQKKALYSSAQGELVKQKFKEHFELTLEHRKALIEGRSKGVYCVDEYGQVVNRFSKVKDAAKWWLSNGYSVKSYDQLCDHIKRSFIEDIYIRGLKWIYVDNEAGHCA